jgi:hypothetical protein
VLRGAGLLLLQLLQGWLHWLLPTRHCPRETLAAPCWLAGLQAVLLLLPRVQLVALPQGALPVLLQVLLLLVGRCPCSTPCRAPLW